MDFPKAIRDALNGRSLIREDLGRSGALVWSAGDMFLKAAPKGTLERAAAMQVFFAEKGFSAPPVAFVQDAQWDYFLCRSVPGKNACRWDSGGAELARAIGRAVRLLHDSDPAGCPYDDCNAMAVAAYGREFGVPFPGDTGPLREDALIQGDCCLPNIFFDGTRFTGFIDLGDAGIGDRHMDLVCALWSLRYNLKTGEYGRDFLDAYGRDALDFDRLELCAAILGYDINEAYA